MLLSLLFITAMGLGALYSAAGGSFSPWALNQGLRFVLLFSLMFAVSLVPMARWRQAAYPLFLGILALLIIVELFGKIGMGAQRWIDLGFIRLQPSEFMKIACVLALARFFETVPAVYMSKPSVVFAALAIVGVPTGLVMLQPDLGTALMISMAGIVVIFMAGVSIRWFVSGAVALAAFVPIGWTLLHDYQRGRILTFMDPSTDPLGSGYHISQSLIAIGSGGLFGKGWLQGSQSHLNFLPETHTDFLFPTLVEEWGVVGGMVVLVRWCMQRARNGKSIFTRLTAIGLAMTLFLYVSINVAMVMGLAPVVGIPLPLLSYGGSAMMTVLILMGIMMAIYREEIAPTLSGWGPP
jgi:rod shape determining protein RodA